MKRKVDLLSFYGGFTLNEDRKIPGFRTGDLCVYMWFSSACTNMGQQGNAAQPLFILFTHNKRPPDQQSKGIMAGQGAIVDRFLWNFSKNVDLCGFAVSGTRGPFSGHGDRLKFLI